MTILPSPLAVVIRLDENGFATDTPRQMMRGVIEKVGEEVSGVSQGATVVFEPKGTKINYEGNTYWIVSHLSLQTDVTGTGDT